VASVWYEHRFRLDASDRDARVGLFLGGFDDTARIWLNGREIGASGRQYSRPALFDLGEALDRSGENRLVIEISREDSVNELGIGGLIRPSFLFAGPIEIEAG
jgi:beta-glucuronidase